MGQKGVLDVERRLEAMKPYDTILKFKIVVLQLLYNLSDEQTEYLIRDLISSCASSIWVSRTRCRMPPCLAVSPSVGRGRSDRHVV
jgi:hypothetical protein